MLDSNQTPATPAEDRGKQRGNVAWRKGLRAGAISFVATWILLLLLVQLVLLPRAIPPNQSAKLAVTLLLTPLELIIGDLGDPLTRGLTLLSGLLVHAAFWTMVFTCWKRQAD